MISYLGWSMSNTGVSQLQKKDSILLHLDKKYSSEEEELFSRRDILENTEVEDLDDHLTTLKREGYISEHRKDEEIYYSLNEKAEERSQELWKHVRDEEIVLIEDKDTIILTLEEINDLLTDRSILEILEKIDKNNKLDLKNGGYTRDELVGRDEEIEELKESVKEAKNGYGKTIFVVGDTGIGKTRLVEEIKRLAPEKKFDFLEGKCYQEDFEPYQPFKQALKKFQLIEKEREKYEDVIDSYWESDNTALTKKMFDAQRKSVFFETTKFIEELSKVRPIIIFFDDLQWADKGTLNLFDYMADRLKDEPVLLIGTYRPGDVSEDSPLKATMRKMSRKDTYKKIELSPLDNDSIKDLMRNITGVDEIPESFIKSMKEKTNGNPLFIKENIEQMMEEKLIDSSKGEFPEKSDVVFIPDIVQDVIEKRIYELDYETREILQLGSVIGKKVPFEILVEASDKEELELLDKIDHLLESNIWIEHPREESFLFTHDLFMETIYEGLGEWLEKKSLHKQVASALKNRYKDELDGRYSVLARHYNLAEKYSKAFKFFRRAGQKAEALYSHEDAVERYKESLKVAEKTGTVNKEDIFEVREKLGETNYLIGDYNESRKYFKLALAKTDDIENQRRMYRKIARTWGDQGEPQKVINITEETLELENTEISVKSGDKSEPTELQNSSEVCQLLSKRGWAFTRIGKYEKASNIFKEELEKAEELGEDSLIAQAYHDLGSLERGERDTDKCIDDLKKAVDIREKILEKNDSIEERFELIRSYNNLGVIYLDRREIQKAKPKFQRVLDLNEKVDSKQMKSLSLQNLALIHRYEGKLDKSERMLKEVLEILDMIGDQHGILLAENTLGMIELERGNIEKGVDHYKKALNIAEEASLKFRIVEVSINLSKAYIWKGDLEEAEKYSKEAHDIAEEIQNNRALGISLRIKGILERLNGELEKSIESHKRGIDITRETSEKVDLLGNILGLVESYIEQGLYSKAEEELENANNLAIDTPYFETWLKTLESVVLSEKENFEEAERKLKESLKIAREVPIVYRIARAKYELGELKKRKGELNEAKELFEEGFDLSEKNDFKYFQRMYKKEVDELTD